MNRIAFVLVLALAIAGPAAAAPLQGFYIVMIRGDSVTGREIMVVSPAEVTTSADGHKIFPVYSISEDATLDTTVLEVNCAAKRRRVLSESLLFGGRDQSDRIDKTGQNDLSWQGYGSDAPADEFVCAGPERITSQKYESVDLKSFVVSAAATLRRMRAEK